MAHARISAKLPPDIDPTKAPIAFGERALPKLNEELQSPELLTRQRALMALCDLVHDPENVYQAIKLGFLDNLKYLLLDEDSTVREKTTEVLYIMATHNVGRQREKYKKVDDLQFVYVSKNHTLHGIPKRLMQFYNSKLQDQTVQN
ncbi:Rhabdoid tumor deletion region protein 1 [Chelonia mydas]|uniref:Rhabdoid tumor deletion region protein 1 n=1 Tax=Chelonia mydas TaxID=8469 RepID=M7B9C1_CHEMY|nr:Rhabdoid tumor deletion region protein 1 [Chelonia mydas]